MPHGQTVFSKYFGGLGRCAGKHLGNAWRLIPEPGPDWEVCVRFSPLVAKNVAEITWHKTQQTSFNPDGSLDDTFGAAPDAGFPEAMVLQADGSILVAGSDYPLRRLRGDLRARLALLSYASDGPVFLRLEGLSGARYLIEASSDLGDWQPVATNRLAGCSRDVEDAGGSGAGQRFYRARQLAD